MRGRETHLGAREWSQHRLNKSRLASTDRRCFSGGGSQGSCQTEGAGECEKLPSIHARISSKMALGA